MTGGHGFDQEIVNDFLTESGELIEQLEADLVVLEGAAQDQELLNKVFRALHTIKGSASFLALTNLVSVAHAAESALNAARNGVVRVDPPMMNLLLEAVDVIKTQMGQLASGQALATPRPELVRSLSLIGEGKAAESASSASGEESGKATKKHKKKQAGVASGAMEPSAAGPVAARATSPAPADDGGVSAVRELALGPGKADLFEYLVADLDETVQKVRAGIESLGNEGQDVAQSARALAERCEELSRCVDFFEFAQMGELAGAMSRAAQAMAGGTGGVESIRASLRGLCELVTTQAAGVKSRQLREVCAQGLLDELEQALRGGLVVQPQRHELPGTAESSPEPQPQRGPEGAQPVEAQAKTSAASEEPAKTKAGGSGGVENTIRVDVGRLEALMNLVGELVLQKNRIAALTRRAGQQGGLDAELGEAMGLASSNLDRVTSDIQMAVMRTRMQQLDKLFGRYPRLIRDLAAKTGKQIQLMIEGGETEVDKSVIEELGDPLVHLIRNSCDHGLEPPDERTAAGKSPTGTITLRASHEGSQVRLLIIDDGRGLSRDRIGRKAVERGMLTPEQLAQLPDKDVYQFIFEAGFSTAEQVSDLSGRGVGMDVVRTNIQKLKGTIELASQPGQGTTISITIPLTVAILPAMMVGVGSETYAVPLTSILEIVRPQEGERSTIGGRSVMRLRDWVLPLVSAGELFGQTQEQRQPEPFAVVLHAGEKRVGLLVSRLIGQQEVVIKPLDESHEGKRARAISGATVRDDGGVSLIVAVDELMRMAQQVG